MITITKQLQVSFDIPEGAPPCCCGDNGVCCCDDMGETLYAYIKLWVTQGEVGGPCGAGAVEYEAYLTLNKVTTPEEFPCMPQEDEGYYDCGMAYWHGTTQAPYCKSTILPSGQIVDVMAYDTVHLGLHCQKDNLASTDMWFAWYYGWEHNTSPFPCGMEFTPVYPCPITEVHQIGFAYLSGVIEIYVKQTPFS